MRVIGGSARGRRLLAPKGDFIRPTLDRVREALFNVLGERVPGSRFLDLFAGTGANGIEALSRGAAAATFVDNDPRALSLIRENLARAKTGGTAECLQRRLPGELAPLRGPFDIVFADPPYAFLEHEALLATLTAAALLVPDAIIVIEHDRRTVTPAQTGAFTRIRDKRYGDTMLSFYA